MSFQFHNLIVSKITPETDDAVSISLSVPQDLKNEFTYTQGQYLTLRFDIGGRDERRAYSLSSSPLETDLTVSVKRVARGVVSNHICSNIKIGDSIAVMSPQGKFFTPLSIEQRKTYYFFGAGSGITPQMSILKTILETEPASTVFLLYGNRDEASIMFKNELDNLQARYTGQLFVEHILSQPKREKSSGLTGLFSKGKISWTGKVGRIDKNVIEAFLEKNKPRSKDVEYFICGPGGMIDAVQNTLSALDIDKKRIHSEHFTNDSATEAKSVGVVTEGAKLTVTLLGKTFEAQMKPKDTILDTLIGMKKDPPYSCTSGACSTCMARLLKGSVKMDACYALDDDEIEKGYILTCQARPTSAEVEVTFEV